MSHANMSPTKKFAIALLASGALFTAGTTRAASLLWTLTNVKFNDGGTATGSFIYDPDTNIISNINIVTTAGSIRTTGATYNFINDGAFGHLASQFAFSTIAAGNDLTGTPDLVLFPSVALTNAGGAHTFLALEGNAANFNAATLTNPQRATTGDGRIVGTVPVPLPSALLSSLSLLPLLAIWKFRQRRPA